MGFVQVLVDAGIYGLGFCVTVLAFLLSSRRRTPESRAFSIFLLALVGMNVSYLVQQFLYLSDRIDPLADYGLATIGNNFLFTILLLAFAASYLRFLRASRISGMARWTYGAVAGLAVAYAAVTCAVILGMRSRPRMDSLEFGRKCLVVAVGMAFLALTIGGLRKKPAGRLGSFLKWFLPIVILNILFYVSALFVSGEFWVGIGLSGYFANSSLGYLLFLCIAVRYLAADYREYSAEAASPGKSLAEALAGFDLSERELEVASCLARGQSNKEISARLFISLATVKTHVHHIFSKTRVSSRTALLALAARRGFSSPTVESIQRSIDGASAPR
jgi:DNA-binding CsgD family transcriptional regulator